MPDRELEGRFSEDSYGTIPPSGSPWLRPGLAIVLDMDGVMIDSNPLHRQAWLAYNRRFGIETTEAMQQRMYGKRNDEIIRDFFGTHLGAEEVAAHGAAKERLYREMLGNTVENFLVPGVRAFLELHRDFPVGLATNAEPANVDFLMDRCSLRKYFKVIVDGHQVERPKPAPDIYLMAARLLGRPAADCIVFEDSFSGVQAARGAGARTVGIRTTHADLPGTDLCVDDFLAPDLESWLRSQHPRA